MGVLMRAAGAVDRERSWAGSNFEASARMATMALTWMGSLWKPLLRRVYLSDTSFLKRYQV
jgi:hypothetical protein